MITPGNPHATKAVLFDIFSVSLFGPLVAVTRAPSDEKADESRSWGIIVQEHHQREWEEKKVGGNKARTTTQKALKKVYSHNTSGRDGREIRELT